MWRNFNYYGKQIIKGFCVTGLAVLGYAGIKRFRTEDEERGFGERGLLSVESNQEYLDSVDTAFSESFWLDSPRVVTPIANQTIDYGIPFEMEVPYKNFHDPDYQIEKILITRPDNSTMPSWLKQTENHQQIIPQPFFVGSFDTPNNAEDIKIIGHYAYVNEQSSLQILDVSNLANPIPAGSLANGGKGFLVYNNQFAYYPSGTNMVCIDITDPSHPTTIGSYSFSSYSFNLNNIGLANNYVFVFSYTLDFVSEATTKTQIFKIEETSGALNSYCSWTHARDSKGNLSCYAKAYPVISGNHVYFGVGGSFDAYSPPKHQITIYDIRNCSLVGSISGGIKADIKDHYLYMIGGPIMKIYDVSSPSLPEYIGSIQTPSSPVNIDIIDNYAYVSDGSSGLIIIDIRNHENPSIVQSYNTPGTAYAVSVVGNYAYIADGTSIQILGGMNITERKALLTGIPRVQDIGKLDLMATAYTNSSHVSTDFSITVKYEPPQIVRTLPNLISSAGYLFSANVLDDTFYSPNGNAFDLEIKQADDSDLPAWLTVTTKPVDPIFLSNQKISSATNSAVYISGNTKYLWVQDNEEITILDITNPLNVQTKRNWNAGGAVNSIAFAGTTAYIAAETTGITILDITNINDFNQLGQYVTKYAKGFTLYQQANPQKTLLFIADGRLGIKIVDITDIRNPKLTMVQASTDALSIRMENNIVFVPDGTNTIKLFAYVSCDQPLTPLSTITLNAVANDIVTRGKYLYVANDSEGLQIFDISDLTNPSLAATLATEDAAFGIKLVGENIYLASGKNGVIIINVSDITNVHTVATYNNNCDARQVTIDEDYVYITDNFNGIKLLDGIGTGLTLSGKPDDGAATILNLKAIADDGSATPPEISFSITFAANHTPEATTYFQSRSINIGEIYDLIISLATFTDADNDRLSVIAEQTKTSSASSANPFLTFSIETQSLGNLDIAGITSLKASSDEKFIFSIFQNKLSAIDISDVSNPNILGSCELIKSGSDVFITDSYAYITYVDGFEIINIADPRNLRFVASLSIPSANTVLIRGNYAYITAGINGLKIIDIKNANYPSLVASLATTHAQEISINNNIVFLADGAAGILSVDITNPLSPSLINHLNLNQTATKICYMASYVYVATEENNILTIDVSDLTAPSITSTYEISSPINAIKAIGDYLYANTASGLIVLNTNDKKTLTEIPISQIVGIRSWHIPTKGSRFFVGMVNAGKNQLNIFDVKQYRLSGTATTEAAGNYAIKLIAKDPNNAFTSTSFSLRVEGPPEFSLHPILNQQAKVNQYQSFFFAEDTFIDPNNDPLYYSANITANYPWPNWLQFNPLSGTFFGTPIATDVGTLNITVTADDRITGTAATTFLLETIFVPEINQGIPNQNAIIGRNFEFAFSQNAFEDKSGKTLTYNATQKHQQSLPNWLNFYSPIRTFKGIPKVNQTAIIELMVTATNGADSVATSFELNLIPNQGPVPVNPIPTQITCTTCQRYPYTIPTETFLNPQNNLLNYSISLANADNCCNQTWPFSFFETHRLFGMRPELVNGWPFWLEKDMSIRHLTVNAPPMWVAPMSFLFWKRYKTYHLQVTVDDGLTQARSVFDLVLAGPSLTETILNTLFSIMGISTMVFGIYGQRYILLNRNWFKKRYQKPNQEISIHNQTKIEHLIKIPIDRISEIKVLTFRNAKKIELTGVFLPRWFVYDETKNSIIADPNQMSDRNTGIFTVQVFDKNNILQEQFDISITDGTNTTIAIQPPIHPASRKISRGCCFGFFGSSKPRRNEFEEPLLSETAATIQSEDLPQTRKANLWNCFGLFCAKNTATDYSELGNIAEQQPNDSDSEEIFEL